MMMSFTNTPFSLFFAKFLAIFAMAFLLVSSMAIAQQSAENDATPNVFKSKVRVIDAVTLLAGETPIHIWGVEEIPESTALLKLKARTSLYDLIQDNEVRCQIRHRMGQDLYAQCVNSGIDSNEVDLSLYMVQQGYVMVDRSVVYGTVFEDAYLQAEIEAQDRGFGVWADGRDSNQDSGDSDGALMVTFGFVLFLCVIAAFAVLSIIIMRGFKKVIDAQNDNIEMMIKERKLREKEREIVAMMLDSELKANKSKIEAYLVVYEEVLTSLKDTNKAPKYKRAGDIVQRQPALDRSVFDRNTDKIDILGETLASELIHFYARIKTSPDYINLEPETDLEEAIDIVTRAVEGAKRLDQLAQAMMDAFEERTVNQTL